MRKRRRDFREKNLQTVQEWNKSYTKLIVLSDSQFTCFSFIGCIPLFKREAKIKIKPNFCVRQVYFTKSCQQICWRANQPFMLSIHHIKGKQYHEAPFLSYRPRTECSFSQFWNTNSGLFENIQVDRSTHFLCTTNYRIDHIIKRFHEENSVMSGLFHLLCRIMMGFWRNRSKIFQNHLYGQPVLTFDKRQICRARCHVFPEH